jgi:hypothetical protein
MARNKPTTQGRLRTRAAVPGATPARRELSEKRCRARQSAAPQISERGGLRKRRAAGKDALALGTIAR